jgi:hypothetical protein
MGNVRAPSATKCYATTYGMSTTIIINMWKFHVDIFQLIVVLVDLTDDEFHNSILYGPLGAAVQFVILNI